MYRETASGAPQLSAQAAYLVVPSAASYSTTVTIAGPPSADERHGFMITLHELPAIEINAGIDVASITAGIGT